MPIIRPFKALRYDTEKAGDIQDLVAPPYDIIYDEWRNRLYARNPYNIIRLIKTKDEAEAGEEPDKYKRAASYLSSWMEKRVLRREDVPALYVRSETFEVNGQSKTRYGFVGLVRLEEFGQNIFAHERTLSGPKVDRLNLVKATKSNLSQVFGTFLDPGQEVQECILKVSSRTPDISFHDEQGIQRKMWILKDTETIRYIQEKMLERAVIIADGHHRYETALAYRELMEPQRKQKDEPFDYISMYFSSIDAPGMTILPTHRKAGGMQSFDSDTFLDKLSVDFEIESPEGKSISEILQLMKENSASTTVIGVYSDGKFKIARLKHPGIPKDLDVEILHSMIIEKILNISREDVASGKFIQFCQSAEHAVEDVDQRKDQIAFFLNPIRPEEMFPRVTKGIRMPQKSTYFFPKTISGLVMYKIDRESLG
ncbi:MAG: DUF1015 domain-containing protein [Candidatus Latescibacterota bacterium]